jgi:hypothetical protein
MMTSRSIDLNIFYREEWDEETQTSYLSDNLFIDVYDYWQYKDDEGYLNSEHAELGVLIECSPEETKVMRRMYPEEEYGYDWWYTLHEAMLPVTVYNKLMKKLRDTTIPVVR